MKTITIYHKTISYDETNLLKITTDKYFQYDILDEIACVGIKDEVYNITYVYPMHGYCEFYTNGNTLNSNYYCQGKIVTKKQFNLILNNPDILKDKYLRKILL